jgi:predicted nucleic acid-binding protein
MDADKQRRLAFIDRLCSDILVYPFTVEAARMAGRIEAELAPQGLAIAFEDLVIGATALKFGFDVATLNVRHFRHIPGLKIVRS